MSSPQYECVVRGGHVATASDDFVADVAIDAGRIVAIGAALGPGTTEIDARGKLVLPGGVDGHCHIEQMSAAGIMNADTFESATASAACGGTTTVISFAAQHVGLRLRAVVDDYLARARRGAIIDYTFHMIVADPTPETLAEDIPALVREGHGSLKVFMTYDRLRLGDEQLLDVLLAARKAGAMVAVHAENHGMVAWMSRKLIEAGHTAPKFHALSHPRGCEAEAIQRLVAFSELLDQPVMVFHVSTTEGAAAIRAARGRGLKVYAETCPQYLLLTSADMDRPGLEGAKFMCSPPPRDAADQEAIWQALALGDIGTVSSDHAPYAFDETGKLSAGPAPTFKQIANGLPGLEVRLPLMFDEMVTKGRLGLQKFVEVTATTPAKIYNLHPRKGSIAVGADADLALWDPHLTVTLADGVTRDNARYTPYAGRTVTGWPVTVLRRGEPVVVDRKLVGQPGSGQFLPRGGGAAARPSDRPRPDAALARRLGADLP